MASDLLVKIGGDTTDFQNSLAGLGQSLMKMVGDLNPIVAGAITTVGGLAVAAVSSAITIEDAFNVLISQTGASGDKLEGLKSTFSDIFTSIPVGAKDAADAISILSDRLNLTGNDLTALTKQLAEYSVATGTNLVANTDAVSKAFLNWNIATGDQGTSLDQLNVISQQTHVSLTTLGTSMADIGNLARMSGEDWGEAASQVGTLSAAGIDASAIFQSMSRAMVQANASGQDLSTVTLPAMVYAIEHASTSQEGFNLAVEDFGARKGPVMFQLIQDGKITVETLTKSIDSSTDSIKNMYSETDTLSKNLSTLGNQLTTWLAPAGNAAVKYGGDIVASLNMIIVSSNALQTVLNGGIFSLDRWYAAGQAMADYMQGTAAWTQYQNSIKDSTAALALQAFQLALNAERQASANDAAKAGADAAAAAKVATAERTAVLALEKTALEDLTQADAQHAADIKALYIPAIESLVNAEEDVNAARTLLKQCDDNLVLAEANLDAARVSGNATSTQLTALEKAVTDAKLAAKDANLLLTDSEKTLTESKLADKAGTDLYNATLAITYKAIADQNDIHTDYIKVITDELNSTKLLDAYNKTVIGTEDDLATSLTNIQVLRQDQADKASALQATLAAENELTKQGVVNETDSATALENSKVAQDAYKASTDLLNTAMDAATKNFGLSKDAILLMTTTVGSAATASGLLQLAYNVLGTTSTTSFQNQADAAKKAFDTIASSGTATTNQLEAAWVAYYGKQLALDQANGTAMSAADQISYANMSQNMKDFSAEHLTQWSDLYNKIDTTVKGTCDDMIKALVTGDGSFVSIMEKGLQDIGVAVLESLVKPFEDAIARLIAGQLTNLISSLGSVLGLTKDIGTSCTTNLGSLTGSTATSGAGGAASAGGSAASAAGSAVSSVMGIVNVITGAISAIANVITAIQGFEELGKLASIEENTRYTQLYLGGRADQGVLGQLFIMGDDLQFGITPRNLDAIKSFSENISNHSNDLYSWIQLVEGDLSNPASCINSSLINITSGITNGFANVSAAIAANNPIVNVAVTLDGAAIAAAVETTIESAIKQAT